MATYSSNILAWETHGQKVDMTAVVSIHKVEEYPAKGHKEDAILAGPPFMNFPSSLTKILISVRYPCLPCCQVSRGVDSYPCADPDPPCQ